MLNGICGIFTRAYNLKEEYRTKNKDTWLVDGMPIFENLMMAFISAVMVPFIGSDGVWLSFPLAELACLAIIAGSVFYDYGKVTFKPDAWLKVDENFGKAQVIERTFFSQEEIQRVSDEVVNFCKLNSFDKKISMFAGVITEELLNNVVIHGAKSKELCVSYIRVIIKDDLYITICDDNYVFNPQVEMKKIESESARRGEEKIGLRLVKQITDNYGSFDYQNTAGINTSIVKLRNSNEQ